MTKYRRKQTSADPFEETQQADNAIFSGGEPQGIVDLRVVAKPTPLAEIWADVKQPRRAIPASIRLSWNGDPAQVHPLLLAWEQAAREKGLTVKAADIIRGGGEGVEVDGLHPIAFGFLELLRLAQDIRRVGLTNPISIISQRGRFLIESGERRYLAYHVLQIFDGETWAKIPAITSNGKDFVWRQASENTARRALNAIGMARQLALLIMDAREGLDGQSYDSYEKMVLPGECDRRFYAQVANGNIHRIPKGFGERIETAMGLSKAQLSRYRDLLKLTADDVANDALWIRADVEDWGERVLREIADRLPLGNLREVIERDEWTLDDLRELIPPPPRNGIPPADVSLPMDSFPSINVGGGNPPTGDTLPIGKVGTSPTGEVSGATDPTNYPVLDLMNAMPGARGRLPERKEVWSMTALSIGEYRPNKVWVDVGALVTVKNRFTQTLRGRKDDLVTIALAGGQDVIVSANPDAQNPTDNPHTPTKPTSTSRRDTGAIFRELSGCIAGTKLLLMSEHRVWERGANENAAYLYAPTDEILFAGTPMMVLSWFVQVSDEGEVDLIMVELDEDQRQVVLQETPAWKQRPTVSDKADSPTPEPQPESHDDALMLNIEGPEYAMLTLMLDIADLYNDAKMREAIMNVLLLSFGEAKKLASNRTLHNQLNEYYQVIERGMQEWLNRISDFLMWAEENS